MEKLLDRDRGHRGSRIPCGKGHEAGFVDYRGKEMETILSAIHVTRAYYHCEICKRGMAPKDCDLDIVFTTFSPGLRRLMARVGGKEAFDEGRRDLEELAGLRIFTEAIRRGSGLAKQIVAQGDGAPWIWNLAAMPFPAAIEIVDLYHAREHLSDLARVVWGPGSCEGRQWAEGRITCGTRRRSGVCPCRR